jgi:MSHA pilin protein MshC
MPELIAVIAIASILAAVGLPRMWASGYDETRLYDETISALRYARRAALTHQRTVCVAFTATSLTLTYSSAYTPPSCDTPLRGPAGATQYVVSAAGAAAYSAFSGFSFDLLGVPSAGRTITIAGGRSIVVEAGTGYVH